MMPIVLSHASPTQDVSSSLKLHVSSTILFPMVLEAHPNSAETHSISLPRHNTGLSTSIALTQDQRAVAIPSEEEQVSRLRMPDSATRLGRRHSGNTMREQAASPMPKPSVSLKFWHHSDSTAIDARTSTAQERKTTWSATLFRDLVMISGKRIESLFCWSVTRFASLCFQLS